MTVNKDTQYELEERAAIMQFDGGVPKEEADAQALNDYLDIHPELINNQMELFSKE